MGKPRIKVNSGKVPQYLKENLERVLEDNLPLYLGITREEGTITIKGVEIRKLSENFRADVYKTNVYIRVGKHILKDERVLEFILKEYKDTITDTSGREPRKNRLRQEQEALEILRSTGRTPKPLVAHYLVKIGNSERYWIIMECLKGNLEHEITMPSPSAISLLETFVKMEPTTRDILKSAEFGWEDSTIEELLESGLAKERRTRPRIIYPDMDAVLRVIEREPNGHYVASSKKLEMIQDTARKVINTILGMQEIITACPGGSDLVDESRRFIEPEDYWANIEIKLLGLIVYKQGLRTAEEGKIKEIEDKLRREVKDVYIREIAKPLVEATRREGRVINIGDCNIGNFYKDPNDSEGMVRVSDLFHLRWGHPYTDITDFLIDLKIKSRVSRGEIGRLGEYAQSELLKRKRRIYDPINIGRAFEPIESAITFDRSIYIGGYIAWMLTERRGELTKPGIREKTRQLEECIDIAKNSAIGNQNLYSVLNQELPTVFTR